MLTIDQITEIFFAADVAFFFEQNIDNRLLNLMAPTNWLRKKPSGLSNSEVITLSYLFSFVRLPYSLNIL